jgi:hypothetical protein
MIDQNLEKVQQEPVKRFKTPEEFRKEYYPKSTQQEAQQKMRAEGEFGEDLALDSLNRHASVLQFRIG